MDAAESPRLRHDAARHFAFHVDTEISRRAMAAKTVHARFRFAIRAAELPNGVVANIRNADTIQKFPCPLEMPGIAVHFDEPGADRETRRDQLSERGDRALMRSRRLADSVVNLWNIAIDGCRDLDAAIRLQE